MGRNGRDMNHTGMLPCLPKVIGVLQPKPMRCIRLTEGHFNPQCHFRRNRSTPIQQLRQRLAAHTKMVGGVGDGQAQGGKHQLLQNFSRMGGVMHTHGLTSSMVIKNLDVTRMGKRKVRGRGERGFPGARSANEACRVMASSAHQKTRFRGSLHRGHCPARSGCCRGGF